MLDYEILNFIREIEQKTGVDIRIKNRERKYVYSRVVFFMVIKKENPRLTLKKMASFLGQNHGTVLHAIASYDYLRDYPDFIAIEREIKAIKMHKEMKKMMYCNPITYPNE